MIRLDLMVGTINIEIHNLLKYSDRYRSEILFRKMLSKFIMIKGTAIYLSQKHWTHRFSKDYNAGSVLEVVVGTNGCLS